MEMIALMELVPLLLSFRTKAQTCRLWAAPSLLCSHAPSSFLQDFLRNLPQRHMELEHRSLRTASPARYFPVRPDELDFRPRRQIEQQRHLFTVEPLRKGNDRLKIPGRAVG